MKSLYFVVCFLCFNLSLCETDIYRAAVVDTPKTVDLGLYKSLIQDAAKSNVDILVLSSPDEINNGIDHYDEAVKALSVAAKENAIYVAAHLYEKTRCQSRTELVRSNLVFDRKGRVVSVYRKPINNFTNCTAIPMEVPIFITDFGLTFGLMMEEDLVLRDVGQLKNVIVIGAWRSEIPFLSASQFSPSWAYSTNANLISSNGIFAGKAGLKSVPGKISVVDLNKNGGAGPTIPPVVTPAPNYPSEDLSQYIVRPLNVEASRRGYTETVCHGKFCCEFYVKTGFVGPAHPELSYGLAAFAGARPFALGSRVSAQTCALFACAAPYKRACDVGLQNLHTNIHFEQLTIRANFTEKRNAHFPLILSTDKNIHNFLFSKETGTNIEKITAEVSDAQNLLSFGIFSRDFTKDFESKPMAIDSTDFYEYLFNEDVVEFFDYVWIRLRILLVVVSIYVLEMI